MTETPLTEPTTSAFEFKCANHPNVSTSLRCQRCEKPICIKCAVRTPTGYKCKECVSGVQKNFETTEWWDYPVAFFTSGLLAFLGSLIVPQIGWFAIFLSPLAGGIIAEVVRFLTRRRRSRLLYRLAASAAVLGALPVPVMVLLGSALGGRGALAGGLFGLLWSGVYLFLMVSSFYYRLSGIQIRR